MTRPDPGFLAYRAISRLFGLVAPAFLAWRQAKGKEHPERWPERRGVPSLPRPPGWLVWLHGASVGESLALLPLVPLFVERGFRVLVTTGTLTSSRVLDNRLPPGAVHQFVPLDVPKFLQRFLAHWRPDLVLLVESELWPNLLQEVARRRTTIALVNARMSARSAAGWARAPGFIAALLEKLDLCLAQTPSDARRFAELGARRVEVVGNLKYDAPPPDADREELAELAARVGGRPVWVAASTHEGEEEIAVAVHRRLAQRFPHVLTILAPRHPERGARIAALVRRHGLRVAQRSLRQAPDRATQVYVADTIGELGLLYRVAGLVFLGKSLAVGGGQSPIEAAKLGCAILHGPAVENFAEGYAALDAAAAAVEVFGEEDLAERLGALFADSASLRRTGRSAGETMEQLCGATQRTMAAIDTLLHGSS